MRRVQHGRIESALPDAASMPVGHMAVGGIQTVQVHHKERHRIGLVPHRDQVKVIGHQAISGDPHGTLFTAYGHQRHKILPIGVAHAGRGLAA